MDSFRVALIGYGLSGACFHAPFISTTAGLELAAIVTGNPERQAQARRAHPQAQVVASVDELWALAGSLQLVVIATANAAHVPLARAAIKRRVPVVVDKPLAASSASARKLVEASHRAGVLLTVFQNRRFDGDFLTLSRVLGDERVGRPLRFESRFERWRPQPRPGFRESAAPEDAGGLLFDLGAHLIDQAVQLFGPPLHVYAEMDCRRPDVTVDDDTFVALTHDLGVHSHLWMSVLASHPGPRFRVLGTTGAFVKYGLDVQEAALRAGTLPNAPGWGEEPEASWGSIEVDGETEARVPTLAGHYGLFYAQMVQALRGDRLPPVNPSESVRVIEIIEAARRSAREKRVIRLEKMP